MPMLRIALPLAAGIASAEYASAPAWLLAAAFVVTGIVAMLFRSQTALLALLVTAGFAAAQLRRTEPAVPVDVGTLFALRIEGIPSDRGRYTRAEAVTEAWRDPAGGRWHAAGDRVVVYADSLTVLEGGERLYVRGTIRPFRSKLESYRRLMLRRGFAGTLRLSETSIYHRAAEESPVLHRSAAQRLARAGLGGDAGAVVRAMTVGDRSGVTPELRRAYARSGMSHLLAVSGLHTGIVFLLVNLALWWLPLLRRGHVMRNVLVIAAVWLFVATAGFPPSAVRAAVMCTLLQFALAAGSEYAGLNALGAAAAGMLLWNPSWLGDIGFQLSFVAVAAILAWGVPLCRRCRTRWKALNLVTDALAIGLTASLATAPLVSHTFGIVPLAGVVLNPAVVVLAAVVVAGGLLSLLFPPLGVVAAGAASLLNTLAERVAALPYGAAEHALPAVPTAALYLLFLLATAAAWSREPKKSVSLPR